MCFSPSKKRMIKGNLEGAYVMANDEELENVKEHMLRRLMEKPNRGPWKDRAEPLNRVRLLTYFSRIT